MRARNNLALFAAVVLAIGSTHAARAETFTVQLSEPSRPAEVRVDIEWGSIHVSGDASAEEVTIIARPDRVDEIGDALIEISENGNRVAILQRPRRPGAFRSANLQVTVPARADLSLVVNRGGDIEVTQVSGLLEVTNLNGSVDLSGLAGAAAVNASNGAIHAGFEAVDADGDLFFASLNGSVELCLPASFAGELHLTTAGDPIRSAFPIVRDDVPRNVAAGSSATVDGQEIRGRIGPGGARLRVSTLNGEIALERCD